MNQFLEIWGWFLTWVFAIGFLIRTAVYFHTEKRQKDEIISALKEIRDNLKKS